MQKITMTDLKHDTRGALELTQTGPITVTRHGEPIYIITSKNDYDALVEGNK